MKLPKLFGVLNITTDSFSDGGKYFNSKKAISHAKQLIADGADVIDIGPASSHPDASPVSSQEEISRLERVIAALQQDNIPISIDSPKKETQQFALKNGVQFINDISGLPHEELDEQIAASDIQVVMMYSIHHGEKANKELTDPEEVYRNLNRFFENRVQRLLDNGVQKSQIILDPGMGFFLGSNPETPLYVLKRIGELKKRFGFPVLISVSRKSFLQKISGCDVDDVGGVTLAAEVSAVLQGVDYIRTHDVKALKTSLLFLTHLDSTI